MTAAAEEKRDTVAAVHCNLVRRVKTASPVGNAHVLRHVEQRVSSASWSHQLEELYRGVVVVQHISLRRTSYAP